MHSPINSFARSAVVKSTVLFPAILLLVVCLHSRSFAQSIYSLTIPGGVKPSTAIVEDRAILIRDTEGVETFYRRDEKFDAEGGYWQGFYSSDARQAIQWPQSNQGPMRIGTLNENRQWTFRTSQMSIGEDQTAVKPILPNANNIRRKPDSRPPLPPRPQSPLSPIQNEPDLLPDVPSSTLSHEHNQAPIPVQLAMGDSSRRRFLAATASGSLKLVPQSTLSQQSWNIVPLANGLARVQLWDNNDWMAIGFPHGNTAPLLYPISNNADQLWRIHPCPGAPGSYSLESLIYPGQALTFLNQSIVLSPIIYSPFQQFWPVAPPISAIQPLYRSVAQNVIPNPQLPPIDVALTNTHSDTLVVLVADRRSGGEFQKFKIASRGSELVQFERDSGATLVETFETRSFNGLWDRRESRTAIPPAPIYDISVYEEFLQSIAIDRTGSSPNPIEDVNYQPRSIGLFLVPPGNQLAANESIDVYATAVAAKNPGAVRRFDQKEYEHKSPASDPLKDILKEFQGRRAAF